MWLEYLEPGSPGKGAGEEMSEAWAKKSTQVGSDLPGKGFFFRVGDQGWVEDLRTE